MPRKDVRGCLSVLIVLIVWEILTRLFLENKLLIRHRAAFFARSGSSCRSPRRISYLVRHRRAVCAIDKRAIERHLIEGKAEKDEGKKVPSSTSDVDVSVDDAKKSSVRTNSARPKSI